MLTIRLTRKGKKNQPFFRVVVIDKRRSSKGGRAVEDLGYKNPLTKKVSIKKERVLYWISKGAQPSATIHNLLVAEKIIEAKKIHVSKLSKKKLGEIKAESAKAEAEKAAKAKAEADASAAAKAKADEAKAEPAAPSDDRGAGEAPSNDGSAETPANPETPAQ